MKTPAACSGCAYSRQDTWCLKDCSYSKKRDLAIYGKTRGKYTGEISNAIRSIWKNSRGRADALKRSRIPCTDGSRRKWLETCEECGVAHPIGHQEHYTKKDGTLSKGTRRALVVHHIEGVPHVFHPNYLRYLFCEQFENPVDGYKVLCHDCHNKVHHGGGE